jgi:hypothetical protein
MYCFSRLIDNFVQGQYDNDILYLVYRPKNVEEKKEEAILKIPSK